MSLVLSILDSFPLLHHLLQLEEMIVRLVGEEGSHGFGQVEEIFGISAARPDGNGDDVGEGIQRLRTQILVHLGTRDEDDHRDRRKRSRS